MRAKKVGILLSGGLDSAALLTHFSKRKCTLWPIYIRCGLLWERAELYWVKKLLKSLSFSRVRPLTILNLSLEQSYRKNWSQTGHPPGRASHDESVFLPARNLLLITKAFLFLYPLQIQNLALGTLKGNPFKDGCRPYFSLLEDVLSKSFNTTLRILTPFLTKTKHDLLQKKSAIPWHLSFSCINPQGKYHCGNCNKCVERKKAFRLAGIKDETVYRRKVSQKRLARSR